MKLWSIVVYINLMVVAAIFCIIGLGLWIAVGVVTNNPPSGSKSKCCHISFTLTMF